MGNICKDFPINFDEYQELNERFGELIEYEAWQLIKKNNRNNHTDSQEDIAQELRIALMRAGSYYKRQVYIESCLQLCAAHAKDDFLKAMVEELQNLWDNKTRHGANRQKFGPHQEKLLYRLTKKIVPRSQWPDRHANLRIDPKFVVYCKNITWNAQKALGKKITREKAIRSGLTSLSSYDYLAKTY